MWSTYLTAHTIDEALSALSQHGAAARIVAGATDLIVEFERGARKDVHTLIDVTRIPGLDAITQDDASRIHLGPLVTHNQCAASPLLRQQALPLAQAAYEVGAPQIRNRSTVAGNLITASPANDTIPALMALDATLVLRSTNGERSVRLAEFYTGVRRTVMQPDEMLVDIHFTALNPASQRGAFMRMTLRRAQAISVINAAVVLSLDAGKVSAAAITLGAVAPTIIRAPEAEAALVGQALDEASIAQAAQLAAAAAAPIGDIRSSADYRKEMVRVAVARLLEELAQSQQPQRIPEKPVLLAKPTSRLVDQLTGQLVENGHIDVSINGKDYSFESGHEKTLLRLLREEALLTGTKEGCAEGECGACTVFMDGKAVMSCLVPAPRAHGATITTVEGLAAADGTLHPLQQAFVDNAAVQCGYCTPGFLMSGVMLLDEHPQPTRQQAKEAVAGNLCRCTGYYKILDAIESAGQI
ncbi:MAG TPA: FAD binding domain-containing protein [Anaerolineales bacterium]|nr:FAD binding domain-containing protein [Anaerolineales bacterium]HRQ91467.1 FAD binding domain-containing protein [Anaerolineales bacterium]